MVAPSRRAPSAIAGTASAGSARPSVGEWMPPIQLPVLPGVIALASAADSTWLRICISRALSAQPAHRSRSPWLVVT